MSEWSSICVDEKANDPIDVAYSNMNPEVRIWVRTDEDGNETTTYLTIEQAQHLIEILNQAIVRAK